VALAGLAESSARYDGHGLLLEQRFGESVAGEPRGGDLREGVESAERLKGPQADGVEAVDYQAPAGVVLGDHALDIGLAGLERLESRVLGNRWSAHDQRTGGP